MCYRHDARPPVAPLAGAAIDSERIVLRAADGARFMAFAARGERSGGPAVVVLPDLRGLAPFYEELALRLAEHGIDALVIDYFGRTTEPGSPRDEGFDAQPHAMATTPVGVAHDVRAAVTFLRERGARGRPLFTLGFCFGGAYSWLQAAAGHGLAGAIGFYGKPVDFRIGKDGGSPIDHVGEYACPVLALQAGIDEAAPPEAVAAFERALADARVPHEVVTYEGAPHSFFDRYQERYQAASDDAWRRALEFIETHS